MSQNILVQANVTSLPATAANKANQAATGAYTTAANTTGYQVKTGSGVLHGLNINTAGTATTATFYDGTSTSGTNLGTYATTALGLVNVPKFAFATGLFVVLAGTTAASVTVFYA